MAYKLKLDENGAVIVKDGKPLYTSDDGSETGFDANEAFNQMHTLREENKSWRLKHKEAQEGLEMFKGVDLETVKANASIAEKFKENEMAQNGEIEKLKSDLAETSKKKLEEISSDYEKRLTDVSSERDTLKKTLQHNTLSHAFANSKYLRDNSDTPPEMIMAMFGNQFKIGENGVIYAIGEDGSKLLSKENLGRDAKFDEAIKIIIDGYVNKDRILRNSQVPGGGMSNNGRGGGNFSIEDKIIKDPKASTSQRLEAARRKQRASGGN